MTRNTHHHGTPHKTHAPRRAEVSLPPSGEDDEAHISTSVIAGLPDHTLASPDLPDTPSDLLPVTRKRRNDIIERWLADGRRIEAENKFNADVEAWLNTLLEDARRDLSRFSEQSAFWQVAVERGTGIVEDYEQEL